MAEGGATSGFKQKTLRPDEIERLRVELEKVTEVGKIPPEEVAMKKDIVKWLLDILKKEIKPKRMITGKWYRAGSAFEKVQAGEANDFDVMVFFNVWRGKWKVVDEPATPGFCSIHLVGIRNPSKKPAVKTGAKKKFSTHPMTQLLDDKQRLCSFKVRKVFCSMVDKLLKRKGKLIYTYTEKGTKDSSKTEKSVDVKVTRVHRGPAVTLIIECPTLGLTPFTIDLVASIQDAQLISRTRGEKYDYVAKPLDKQKAFTSDRSHLWRESYSKQERKVFTNIDKENQIHRKVLRVFKILRTYQSQLKFLKSYVYKNVLLQLSKDLSKSWRVEDFPHRFIDMVLALRDHLATRSLPVYFNERINILDDYDESQISRIMGYLRRIANKGLEGYLELLSLKEKEHMLAHEPALHKKRKRHYKPKQQSAAQPKMSIEKLLQILKSTKTPEARKNLKKRKRELKESKTKVNKPNLTLDMLSENQSSDESDLQDIADFDEDSDELASSLNQGESDYDPLGMHSDEDLDEVHVASNVDQGESDYDPLGMHSDEDSDEVHVTSNVDQGESDYDPLGMLSDGEFSPMTIIDDHHEAGYDVDFDDQTSEEEDDFHFNVNDFDHNNEEYDDGDYDSEFDDDEY